MLTLTTTPVSTQERDGRAFDEVSDAVDGSRCTFLTSLISKSDYTPRLQ
jgi:hypothetical protein